MVAVPGGVITVKVGPNDTFVEVGPAGAPATKVPVTPDKENSVPVPSVPPGTIVFVSIGQGLRRRIFAIEIIAPGP
jgi:hypothetical protein